MVRHVDREEGWGGRGGGYGLVCRVRVRGYGQVCSLGVEED